MGPLTPINSKIRVWDLESKLSTSDWWGTNYLNKIYNLVPVSNPNTNYCFVMNSVWFACPSITEDFSCFSLQVWVWQSLSYLWSLWFQKNGCCCFLLPQESFWWFLILSSASLFSVSPAIPNNQGKEKGEFNENILCWQPVL